MTDPGNKLIVALDIDDYSQAVQMAGQLKPYIGAVKIGMQLYTSQGPRLVRDLQELGCKVFVDLKFHDIPNTVAQAGRVMTRLGVFMFNVHAAGGREMMRQTALAVREEAGRLGIKPPLVLAVTVLTSFSEAQWREEVGGTRDISRQVETWAMMAQDCGLDGVVASPQEIGLIRQICGSEFLVVTPGVRPGGAELDDQHRVMTPAQAVQAGASFLVVGRPILKAADPIEACRRIAAEMNII